MSTAIYWIEGPWAGRLAIVPRPRGGDWLEDEIKAWKKAGMHMIVSALTPDEVTDLELDEESKHAHAHGLQFFAAPIPDRGIPGSPQLFTEVANRAEQYLREGKNVAVHCRQGIGRSALLAAGILLQGGVDPSQALRRIEKARSCPVPDTAEQRSWILQSKRLLTIPTETSNTAPSNVA